MGSCGVGDGYGRERGAKFRLAAGHAAAAADAGDALSDSESEDEEDDAPMPTPADARTMFDEAVAHGASSGGNEGASTQLEEGRGRTGAGRKKGFARDEATAALEAERRAKRIQDAERLADRMHAIGAEVQDCWVRSCGSLLRRRRHVAESPTCGVFPRAVSLYRVLCARRVPRMFV